jgi:Proteasome maturation factor UMP1
MSEAPKIPITKQAVSMMESGLNGNHLAVAAAERHPVDTMQRFGTSATTTANPYRDIEFVRSVYGSSLAMQMAAERQMARTEKYGMGSEHIGSVCEDIVMGNDTSIQFADFMSLPEHRPDLPKTVFHPVMQNQLKK